MANPMLSGNRLLSDTRAIPDTLASLLAAGLPSVETEMSIPRQIVLSGSGDLHHAALSMRLAIERLTGVPTIALPSMQTGLYQSPSLGTDDLVIQMSFSGITARAIEAATLANARGAQIWAITADPESKLATIADRHFLKPPTGDNEAVGFQITMAMLLTIGVGIGQRSGCVAPDEAAAVLRMLAESPADMRRTIAAAEPAATRWAERIKDAPHVLFLATGPTWGTAVNATARVMEAAGASASAQDIEEWVHLDRWVGDKALPVVLIAPPGPGSDRAVEVAHALHALGKTFLVVTSVAEAPRYSHLSPVMAVSTNLPEELAPLVYNLPCELIADHMCLSGERTPYRSDDPAYAELGEIRWGGCVRTLPIRVSLPGNRDGSHDAGIAEAD